MSRGMRALLSYIVSRYATVDEQRAIDREAGAQVQGDELEADKAAVAARERAAADRQADAFIRGLNRAWDRHKRGGEDVTLDDRDPAENAMAAALINFLVRFGLASSHSREVGDQQYAYVIRVNWDQLRELAAANGQRLDDLFDSPNGAA